MSPLAQITVQMLVLTFHSRGYFRGSWPHSTCEVWLKRHTLKSSKTRCIWLLLLLEQLGTDLVVSNITNLTSYRLEARSLKSVSLGSGQGVSRADLWALPEGLCSLPFPAPRSPCLPWLTAPSSHPSNLLFQHHISYYLPWLSCFPLRRTPVIPLGPPR